MKNIIIIGARADGHAKVVYEIILAMKKYNVIGFIDDDESKQGALIRDKKVIGKMADLIFLKEKHNLIGGIVAIGNNKQRRELSEQIKKSGLELINAIHPTVHFDSDVKIGEGCYIGQGAIVVTGTKIGNCVNIHTGTTIDHDNSIEDGANLGPGVHTAGRVKIGKDAFIGTGAAIIPDAIIEEGAIVGAGSVVLNKVFAYTKVVGVPARKIP